MAFFMLTFKMCSVFVCLNLCAAGFLFKNIFYSCFSNLGLACSSFTACPLTPQTLLEKLEEQHAVL